VRGEFLNCVLTPAQEQEAHFHTPETEFYGDIIMPERRWGRSMPVIKSRVVGPDMAEKILEEINED